MNRYSIALLAPLAFSACKNAGELPPPVTTFSITYPDVPPAIPNRIVAKTAEQKIRCLYFGQNGGIDILAELTPVDTSRPSWKAILQSGALKFIKADPREPVPVAGIKDAKGNVQSIGLDNLLEYGATIQAIAVMDRCQKLAYIVTKDLALAKGYKSVKQTVTLRPAELAADRAEFANVGDVVDRLVQRQTSAPSPAP